MKIALFGATDLTLSVANFLFKNKYEISAIVTIPNIFNIGYDMNPIQNFRFADMSIWGNERKIPNFFYKNVQQTIRDILPLNSDFAIVAGWYHLIPESLRLLFSKGCSGFHASLLPQLRGGAPLNWAILLGLKETGVSFFELSNQIDDGLLYAQRKFCIESQEDVSSLIKKTEFYILEMLREILPNISQGSHKKIQQVGVPSYGGQRRPEDSLINWRHSAEEILRLIRASTKPYTGAYTFFRAYKILIFKAVFNNQFNIVGFPGQLFKLFDEWYVSCRKGSIKLLDFFSEVELKNQSRFTEY
ncbi:MAG: formyltransferase family protein [Rickettsia endosymbiont of Ixodes persulcatus]|nr:formyltransferase family protein [Rickettsia endosymbiont of Ixodes persulcatus]